MMHSDFLLERGVAQPGSASGLGPEGRRFESCRPDQKASTAVEAFLFPARAGAAGRHHSVVLCQELYTRRIKIFRVPYALGDFCVELAARV